jgi:competence ComEA-like helix-hairpin-helix protein
MEAQHGITEAFFFAVLLFAPVSRAAFETVPESPWQQGGPASRVFPTSPLVIFGNPASLGLLECPGVAASASRPFGLDRLDRTAIAGGWMGAGTAAGLGISLSGDGAYTETTLCAGGAWRAWTGLALGLGIAARHLQISSYGTATGFTADIGAVWSPVQGIYSAAALRSVLRTDLGDSGDPAAPQVLEAAVGMIPVSGITVSIGVAQQEWLGPEVSICTSFSPAPPAVLSAGIQTDPGRFWASLTLSLGRMALGYGYSEHPTLPGSHSLALCWGGCGADPEPVEWGEDTTADAPEVPSFPLNVNQATVEQLIFIPGIGPARASTIVAWIEENGPVESVEELDDIPGIGPSLLAVLRSYLVAE